MVTTKAPATRGRPRSITDARIIEAGMQMTLPSITLTGVAALMGVSHIALYKHVASVDALKRMVANAIFAQWQPPAMDADTTLQDYLLVFADSMRALVLAHPGLTEHLVRRDAKSAEMVRRINAHHATLAAHFAMPVLAMRWLLSTVALHAVALADTVYSPRALQEPDDAAPSDPVTASQLHAEYQLGMRALVTGALALYRDGDLPGHTPGQGR